MTTERKLIMRKISLLDLAEELKNVSEACRIMRVSQDTFYRVKNAYAEEGMEGLREKTRRKPNLSNRVPSEVETAVLAYSLEHPTVFAPERRCSSRSSPCGTNSPSAGDP